MIVGCWGRRLYGSLTGGKEVRVKKFINHVDHVAWVSRVENLDANVAQLEKLSGAKLARFERKDMGFVICVSWAAGLEVLAPLDQRTAANQAMHDWLETRGEGVMFVIFGVADLTRHKAKLEALGIEVGPEVDDHPASPWHEQLVLRERIAGTVMNSLFVLGQIDYADGLISLEDV
jgi:hypothetical protein